MGLLMADASAVAGAAFGHTLRVVQGLAWVALGATVLTALVPWHRAAHGAGRWQRWHLALVVAAGFVAVAVAWRGGLLWWDGRD